MQESAGHIYFIFDPQFRSDDLYPETSLHVEEWAGDKDLSQNNGATKAFELWAEHIFINAEYQDDEEDDDYSDGTVGVYSKSHNSSAALRCANHPLYTLNVPAGSNQPKVTIGYRVALPEHLSQRQKAWFELFELPSHDDFVTVTVDEYHLLRHIKVLSPSHQSRAIEAYQITNPLAQKINFILDGIPPSLTAVSPSTAIKIISLKTQFLESLKSSPVECSELYRLQADANRHLIIRSERLNQIKALIYSDYYVSPSRYLSDTHKITPSWIQKRPIYDADDLLYKEYGVDGWFRSEYQPNTLLIALTALACIGYWPIDCDNDNSLELLTTAAEGFLYAHQSDDSSNRRLYQTIYHPQNPFDLKKDLTRFNALMPVLAAICQEPTHKGVQMAKFFDDGERTRSLIDVLLTENGHENVIKRFIDAMTSN